MFIYLGFVLTTLPIDVIFNSTLRDNIIYSIGQLSLPELMVACNPEKLPLLVSEYTTLIVSLNIKQHYISNSVYYRTLIFIFYLSCKIDLI